MPKESNRKAVLFPHRIANAQRIQANMKVTPVEFMVMRTKDTIHIEIKGETPKHSFNVSYAMSVESFKDLADILNVE